MKSSTIDKIEEAIREYNTKWQTLLQSVENSEFFSSLVPTAIGWKVKDQTEYQQMYQELHRLSDITVETWMNERWIAKMHLKDHQLSNGVEIIKIMQIRPGSEDPLGLDHMDFYFSESFDAEKILQSEKLKWSKESNDILAGYEWLSVWFEDTEAKLKPGTVLDTITERFNQLNQHLTTK